MKPHPKFPDSAVCERCELRFPIGEMHCDDGGAWWCGPHADAAIAAWKAEQAAAALANSFPAAASPERAPEEGAE